MRSWCVLNTTTRFQQHSFNQMIRALKYGPESNDSRTRYEVPISTKWFAIRAEVPIWITWFANPLWSSDLNKTIHDSRSESNDSQTCSEFPIAKWFAYRSEVRSDLNEMIQEPSPKLRSKSNDLRSVNLKSRSKSNDSRYAIQLKRFKTVNHFAWIIWFNRFEVSKISVLCVTTFAL